MPPASFLLGPDAVELVPPAQEQVLAVGHRAGARAGLEDTLYLRKGEIAQGNTPLVQRTADLARSMDLSIASVEETEQILSLPPR